MNSDTINTLNDTCPGESLIRGIYERNGLFVALTFAQSKAFKTRAGAVRWLARRGLNEFGMSA